MIDEKTIRAAETILAKGYCVELRPIKGGVAVLRVIRERVTEKQNRGPSS